MGITAKELAEKLGLSEAAISMALNEKPGVSTNTRKKILEAAEKYGYDFTRITKQKKQTGSISFVIYKKHGAVVTDTPFFSQLSEGIEKACKQEGYKLNIRYLYDDETIENQIEDIQYSDCIGILLLGTEMRKEDLKPFSKLIVPLVLLDVYFDSIQHDCILINNVQGAFLAVDHLIRKTKEQPGYLKSSYSIRNFSERADGFYKAVRSHGMSASKSIVHLLPPSVEGAYADMSELLTKEEETARCYFADNDLIAVGAMKAFLKAGYQIPQDVAIVGFDNLPISSYFEPTLTTIHVPKQYMGEQAVKRLMELLEAEHFVPVKTEISTNLIIRRSV